MPRTAKRTRQAKFELYLICSFVLFKCELDLSAQYLIRKQIEVGAESSERDIREQEAISKVDFDQFTNNDEQLSDQLQHAFERIRPPS